MKTAFISGSTDGIGKQTALELARRGYSILLHGRNQQRGKDALAELSQSVPEARLQYFNADLSSLEEVRRLAGEIRTSAPQLDVLLLNAGISLKERILTVDGLEMTFAVNYLAPFLLTHLLLEPLMFAGAARVVTVSSSAHSGGRIEFDNLQGERRFDGWQAYCDSKLMNVLFARELAERMKTGGAAVTSNSLHPGVIATKLLHSAFPEIQGSSLAEGSQTSVYLAASPEVEGVSGKYFRKMRTSEASPLAEDAALRARLWATSLSLAGLQN